MYIQLEFTTMQIWLRARVHATRSKGKSAFIVLRQRVHTLQLVIMVGDKVSKQLLKFAAAISKVCAHFIVYFYQESIVDVYGTVKKPDGEIASCTQKDAEIHVKQVII